ncbi:GTP cyclohydrolase II [Nocardia sp. NPDC127526]|uniref:GTP cyclohydrolase II n=1 Tax=Nocardia sp. NPDC127526 TaxID=3345393 RepID=UPI00363A0033
MRVATVAGDHGEGHALLFGTPSNGCLVRIHSRCLYGDALESDDCDCGPELDLAMDMIQAEGAGVLLYLEQEGRGAGLVAKARGYRLSQTANLDTFASYAQLGYEPDGRTYDHAAGALKDLGLQSIRLLTNNPDKVATLRAKGLAVEHLPLQIAPRNRRVRRYLAAKRVKRAHRLPQQWLTDRILNGLPMIGYVAVVGGGCGVLVWILATRVIGDVVPPEHVLSTALGLAAGGWGWSRTRLLRARFHLLRGRLSSYRIQPPEG